MAKRKGERTGGRSAKLWMGAIVTAFVAAVAVYLVMLQIEKNVLEGYERTEVLLAICDIPAGVMLTEDNIGEYLLRENVDSKLVPESALISPDQMLERVAVTKIDKGCVLTEGMFRKLEEITAGMQQPVIAGFRAEDLYQVVGGVLRAGDRIHIYRTEEEMGTFLLWDGVYVQQVFDSAGTAIESDDKVTAAQRINIFLDKSNVEQFYSGLEQGSLRVVKAWE